MAFNLNKTNRPNLNKPPRSNRPAQPGSDNRREWELPPEEEMNDNLVPARSLTPSQALIAYPALQLADMANEALDAITGSRSTIMATPPGMANPFDCDAYPNRPGCEDAELFAPGTFAGIEREITRNGCEVCITLTPVLGFMRLPPVTVCRRRDDLDCRPQPPPPPPVRQGLEDRQEYGEWFQAGGYHLKRWDGSEYIINSTQMFRPASGAFGPANNRTTYQGYQMRAIDGDIPSWLYKPLRLGPWTTQDSIDRHIEELNILFGAPNADGFYKIPATYTTPGGVRVRAQYFGPSSLYWNNSAPCPPPQSGPNGEVLEIYCHRTQVDEVTFFPIPPPQPFLLPTSMNQQCCPQTNNEIRALRRKVNRIFNRIGNVKAKVPARLVTIGSNPNKLLEVYSIADWMEYLLRVIDRSVGWLPVEVELKDSNLGRAGNQTTTVRLETFSDAFKHLIEVCMEAETDIDAIMNLIYRNLFETGLCHKLVAENQLEIQEIIEFLGFECSEAVEEVPFCFNPAPREAEAVIDGDDSEGALEAVLPRILDNSKVKVKYTQNTDKRTLKNYLLEIMKDTGIAANATGVKVKNREGFDLAFKGFQTAMDVGQLLLLRQIKQALYGKSPEEFAKELDELERRYTRGHSQPPSQGNNDEPYQEPTERGDENNFKVEIQENFTDRYKPTSPNFQRGWTDVAGENTNRGEGQ